MKPEEKRTSVHDQINALRSEVREDKAERLGRSRFMRVVLTIFGGAFTSAIVGFFYWMQSMNASAQSQAMSIERLAERVETIEPLTITVTEHARDIALAAQQDREILRRLNLLEESNQAILTELRSRPRRR